MAAPANRRAPDRRASDVAARARVVLIDDDPAALTSLTPFFTLAGFDVTPAESGAAGLRAARAAAVHAIVCDLCLPDLTGLDVLAQLRVSGLGLPVVLMSGYDTPELQARAMELGAARFLRKPVDGDELVRTVRSVLQVHEVPGDVRVAAGGVPPPPSKALAELRDLAAALERPRAPGASLVAERQTLDEARRALLAGLVRTLLRPDLSVRELLACGTAMRQVLTAGCDISPGELIDRVTAVLAPVGRPREEPWHPKVVSALARLANAEGGGLGLSEEELGEAEGVSGSRLGRLLRDDIGLGFRMWRRAFRMRCAVRRLSYTTDDVSEIACWLGYGHPNQFTGEFHEVFGLSPRAFRRALRLAARAVEPSTPFGDA